MRKLVLRRQSQAEFERLAQKKYGVFLFAETLSGKDELIFWNSQRIIPPKVDYAKRDTIYFDRSLNGYFVVQKSVLALDGMSNNMAVYIVIPVVHKYYVETVDSKTAFAHDESAINRINLSEEPTDFSIRSVGNQPLFFVKQAPPSFSFNADLLTAVLRLTGLLFLLIALHLYANQIYRKWGGVKGIFFLCSVLLLVRLVLFYFPHFFFLRQFTIFDPAIYGSSIFNRSLGDLLINAVLLCWTVFFAWHHLGPIRWLPSFLKRRGIQAAGVVGIFLLVFVTFGLANVIYNLVVNSKISFEVTDYSKLDANTGFSFLILALLSLSFYYFSRLLFRFVLMAIPNLLALYLVVAIAGLILLTFQTSYLVVLFHLPVLLWLVFYTLVLTQEQAIINRLRITIAGILFWIFLFSVSLAALIMQGNRQREQQDRKRIAINYADITEPTRERSLSIALRYLDNRFLLSNFQRFYHELDNRFLRDSIANANLTASSITYNTNIYVFDSSNKGINNVDDKSFAELNTIYTAQSRPTGSTDLYFFETSFSEFMYIVKRPVMDSTALKGTIFILSAPKFFHNKALYPNLFGSSASPTNSPSSYIFAVYKSRRLALYSGVYPFPVVLNEAILPQGEFINRENDGYDELWFKAANQKVIVVAKKKESLIESITLFSYLFCSFLLMVGLIRLFEISARIVKEWPRVDLFSRMNIRSQIHVTIIFISILSFLIIGVATISFFEKRFQRSNTERLSRTATGTLNEIQKLIKENKLEQNAGSFSGTESSDTLRKFIKELSDVHSEIINIYDPAGNLLLTSDERIYHHGVLSTKMEPTAFYNLALQKEVQRVQNETVGNIGNMSIYMAMPNSRHETYAYLNVPSFNTLRELDQEIANFLVTIINLNAFIVLIAGVIALFITNRITRSFSVIGNKMKDITLGKTNEEIEWNKADEIGELVKQYNKMVMQLEQSAAALAKSEREGAWREMARQVAHEIKNPLTPMKLSIQYLQKAIQNNQPNVKDLTTSVANTLIEQIDHLSKIAADFSQFANIDNKRVEEIDLHNVIGSLLDLYSTNPRIAVTWKPVQQELTMRVDKTHMNRLFTNLLTNAVDACSEREKCIVSITEEIADQTLLIAITDNGDGIPKEMQSKIFTPNFTTKTSGTGLGLAMCKGIVEQAGGNIWFETMVGKGTTFFVQLPLNND